MKKLLACALSFSLAAPAWAGTAAPFVHPGEMVGQVRTWVGSGLLGTVYPTASGEFLALGGAGIQPASALQPGDPELLAAFMARTAGLAVPGAADQRILVPDPPAITGADSASLALPTHLALIHPTVEMPVKILPGDTLQDALLGNPSQVIQPRSPGTLLPILKILRQTAASGQDLRSLDDGKILGVVQAIFDGMTQPGTQATPGLPAEVLTQLPLLVPAGAAPEAQDAAPTVLISQSFSTQLVSLMNAKMEQNTTLTGKDGDAALGRIIGHALARVLADGQAKDPVGYYDPRHGLYVPDPFQGIMNIILEMQRLNEIPLTKWLAHFAPEPANNRQLDKITLTRRMRLLNAEIDAFNAANPERPLPRLDETLNNLKILVDQDPGELFPGNQPEDARRIMEKALDISLKKAKVPPLRPIGAFRLGEQIFFVRKYAKMASPPQLAAAILALRMGQAGFSEAEITERVAELTGKAFHKAVVISELQDLMLVLAGAHKVPVKVEATRSAPEKPPSRWQKAGASARAAWAGLRRRASFAFHAAIPYTLTIAAATTAVINSWFEATHILILALIAVVNHIGVMIVRRLGDVPQKSVRIPVRDASNDPSPAAQPAVVDLARFVKLEEKFDDAHRRLHRDILFTTRNGDVILRMDDEGSNEVPSLRVIFKRPGETVSYEILPDEDERIGSVPDVRPVSAFIADIWWPLEKALDDYLGNSKGEPRREQIEGFLKEFQERLEDLSADGGNSWESGPDEEFPLD